MTELDSEADNFDYRVHVRDCSGASVLLDV